MRILGIEEDLEQKRAALSAHLRRPVLVTSAFYASFPARFRTPSEDTYHRWTALDLFGSTWWDQGRCVGMDGHERLYDLVSSPTVQLAYPIAPKEVLDHDATFAMVGLRKNLNERRTIRATADEAQSEKWAPWIRESITTVKRTHTPGVAFLVSEDIGSPHTTRHEWHRVNVSREGFRPAFDVLQPPGQYPYAFAPGVLHEWNRMALQERDPGPCVVCHGARGERRHLGTLVAGPEGAWVSNLICRACFYTAAKEWLRFLNE